MFKKMATCILHFTLSDIETMQISSVYIIGNIRHYYARSKSFETFSFGDVNLCGKKWFSVAMSFPSLLKNDVSVSNIIVKQICMKKCGHCFTWNTDSSKANMSKQIIKRIGSLVFSIHVWSFPPFLISINFYRFNLVICHRKQILVDTIIGSEQTSFDTHPIYRHLREC